MPKIREANILLAAYVHTLPNAAYIDVFTAMLDSAGNPRADLFGPDRLHMNDSGYALWTSIVGAYVTPVAGNLAAGAVPTEVATPVPLAVGTPAPMAAAVSAPPGRATTLPSRAVYHP